MEGVLAIVFIFGGGTLLMLSFSPVGRAFAERLRGHSRENDMELLELRDQVDHLRAEQGEILERLDFAERLLAPPRDSVDHLRAGA